MGAMSKNLIPPTAPPNNVTQLPTLAVVGNAPPVVKNAQPYRAFDDYRKLAEQLSRASRNLSKALKSVYPHCPRDQITAAEEALAAFERYDRKRIKMFDEQSCLFNPDSAYDEDGEILRPIVASHVAMLVGSFPNANPPDPKVYVKMLIDEVAVAQYVTVTTIEAAFRSIRRTSKFLPTVSEVLAEIKKQEDAWTDLNEEIIFAEERADDLKDKIEEEKERRAVEAAHPKPEAPEGFLNAQSEKRQNTPHTFSVGDRVEHEKFGDGTVSEVDGNKHTVKFDKLAESKKVVGEFLRHSLVWCGK
jgi:hypothetical protein